MEITVEQLKQLEKDSYILVDIRDEEKVMKNPIEGSIALSEQQVYQTDFDQAKKIIVICDRGKLSIPSVLDLRERGYDAYSLHGGYVSIVMDKMKENRSKEVATKAERSIIKTYRKQIWSKFTKAVRDYELVKEGDKIAVCISGGKDSMLMAKCFQELHKYSDIHFDVKYIVMDPGYSGENRQIIEENAKKLNIPVEIFETDIFENVFHIDKNPCYICARMRRGHLYNYAKNIGCNKIALGHHYDDVIETILMSMLYGAQVQTMMPKLHSNHFEGMEVIRPLYLIHEDDIKAWAKFNDLYFIQCACKFTDTCSSEACLTRPRSKRVEVKNLIRELKKTNPYVEQNIFKSVENVSLKTIIAYKDDKEKHHFLDHYDEKK
jgi:tRNA 2-thiocytidine biosynthesis protein TtcA